MWKGVGGGAWRERGGAGRGRDFWNGTLRRGSDDDDAPDDVPMLDELEIQVLPKATSLMLFCFSLILISSV